MTRENLYQIGSFCFRLIYPEELLLPENMEKFMTEEGTASYTYQITVTDQPAKPEGKLIAGRPDLAVFQTAQGEERLLGIKGMDGYYAFYRELAEDRAEVIISAAWQKEMRYDVMFSSILALERRMIALDGLVLHCAYLRHEGEAILFSAPSETGKSTQAGLWEQYRGSRTINGDRALLQRVNGRWTAHGWPVCGSSEICHNLSTPVRAIVMLSQGKENQVRRLRGSEAFMLLFAQITVNRWNARATEHMMNLLEELCGQIPIWHLSCTISEEAVSCLEQALQIR